MYYDDDILNVVTKNSKFIFSTFVLMRFLLVFICCFQLFFVQAQEIETAFVKKIALKADRFIGVDSFENYYYIIGSTFYKKTSTNTYSYNNTRLGEIATVDLSNPLKIILFYRDFNVMVILDNRLNELTDSINFSIESFTKNVAFVSVSSNNNIWLYSLDDNILSLWNYETKKTIFNTEPLSFYSKGFEADKQISSYEFCWLVSDAEILQFNEYGSFITSIKSATIEKIQSYLDGYLYLDTNEIYYREDTGTISEVLIDNLDHKITNFMAIKNNLYFFDANVLYKYTLLKK